MSEPKRLRIDGQAMRLLRWLRDNPGASSLEITEALRLVNVTGRVSDLRAAGFVIECRRDGRGVRRYVVRDVKAITVGVQEGLAL